MIASRLFREPMTLLSATVSVGPDGRPISTETPVALLGAFRRRATIDSFSDGVVVTDELLAYLPEDCDAKIGDRLVVRGDAYEVVSTDFPQVNLRTGRVHHRQVRARRSTR